MAIGGPADDGADPDDGEGGGGGLFADINITPLTDVFLVMVIIFMVSALAAQVDKQDVRRKVREVVDKIEAEKRSGLKVNLPAGDAQELDTSKESLTLTIPVDGDVVVGGRPIADAELDNLLSAAYLRDHDMQVVLSADQGVSHGRVVGIMERAKRAGLSRLAIGTK
ncbi:MAG: biopolymer transporter ExbD [Kofleriaceae bacterium]